MQNMKYSKLMIPIAALFALSSCSPKVSNNMASSADNTSSFSGDGSALKASQEQQKPELSLEVKEDMPGMKPSNAIAPSR